MGRKRPHPNTTVWLARSGRAQNSQIDLFFEVPIGIRGRDDGWKDARDGISASTIAMRSLAAPLHLKKQNESVNGDSPGPAFVGRG